MDRISKIFREAFSLLQPPPDEPLSEYAEKYRVLSAESSAVPGLLSFTGAEYQREMHDVLTDPEIETVVYVMPSQTGKSTVIENLIMYIIDVNPMPILLVRPTGSDASSFSRERIIPLFRDNTRLHSKLSSLKARNSDNLITFKRFTGGFLAIVSAQSPSSLASRPIPCLIMDETSRYPRTAGDDGDPVDLAIKRTTNFANSKIVLASTPIFSSDRIIQEYEASDQRVREISCPACGHWQTYRLAQFRFEVNRHGSKKTVDPESIRYECESCSHEIPETMKGQLEAGGRWRKQRPEVKRRAGFHMTAFHSPWVRWSEILQEHIDTEGRPDRQRVFLNTRLAEGVSETIEKTDAEALFNRFRGSGYKRGEVPDDVGVLVAFCDVQHNRLELEIAGFGPGNVLSSVDYRVIVGDTMKPYPWTELEKLFTEEFQTTGGRRLRVFRLGLDSGDGNTVSQVYGFYLRHPGRVILTKGRRYLKPGQHLVAPASYIDYGGLRIPVYGVDTTAVKNEVYSRFSRAPGDPGEFRFPEDYELSYFEMLTAEEKQLDRNGKEVWVNPTRRRNEALDCRVGVIVLGELLCVETTSEETWKKLLEAGR